MRGEPLFRTRFTVRVSDVNYGAHLGNDRVLALFHEARVRWLAAQGWSEMDLDGVGLIQTEAHLQYRAQSRLGDELECGLALAEVCSRGFTLAYLLERPSDRTVIAKGTTVMRCFDYESQRIARVPPALLALAEG